MYERINFTGRQARTYRARRREDEQTEQEGPKAELPYAALYHDEGLMGDLSCVLSNEDARASEDVRRQGQQIGRGDAGKCVVNEQRNSVPSQLCFSA